MTSMPPPAGAEGTPLIVWVEEADQGCRIAIAGRQLPDDPGLTDEIERIASDWPNRHAIVEMGYDAPYRCVGGVLFALQRAQFRDVDVRAGEGSAFAMRQVVLQMTERDGACRATIKDNVYILPADQERLEASFRSLAEQRALVILTMEPDATNFECFRELILLAQQTGVSLSFVAEPAA